MKGISGTLECFFYFPQVSHKSAPGGGSGLAKGGYYDGNILVLEVFPQWTPTVNKQWLDGYCQNNPIAKSSSPLGSNLICKISHMSNSSFILSTFHNSPFVQK